MFSALPDYSNSSHLLGKGSRSHFPGPPRTLYGGTLARQLGGEGSRSSEDLWAVSLLVIEAEN